MRSPPPLMRARSGRRWRTVVAPAVLQTGSESRTPAPCGLIGTAYRPGSLHTWARGPAPLIGRPVRRPNQVVESRAANVTLKAGRPPPTGTPPKSRGPSGRRLASTHQNGCHQLRGETTHAPRAREWGPVGPQARRGRRLDPPGPSRARRNSSNICFHAAASTVAVWVRTSEFWPSRPSLVPRLPERRRPPCPPVEAERRSGTERLWRAHPLHP